jgi:hypothetical protein
VERFEVIPFEVDHVDRIKVQMRQRHERETQVMTREHWEVLRRQGHSFSMQRANEIVAMAGVVPRWHGVAECWLQMTDGIGPKGLLIVTRRIIEHLDKWQPYPYRRVEAVVRSDWPAAHRWAQRLGFDREGTMTAAGPGGMDYDLYARIRRREEER